MRVSNTPKNKQKLFQICLNKKINVNNLYKKPKHLISVGKLLDRAAKNIDI